MWLKPYLLDDTLQDVVALLLSLAACATWLRIVDIILEMRWIGRKVARKVIHTGIGPIYMLMWNFFSKSSRAPYFASITLLVVMLHYFLVGTGLVHNPQVVLALTRRGDPKEILRGPMYYGIAALIATNFYWRHSPTGILMIAVMSGGDGLADIVGRKYGYRKLPFSPEKSWAGSTAMLLGSFVFGFSLLAFFNFAGNFYPVLSLKEAAVGVAVVSVAATLTEALPLLEVDNLTISFAVWAICSRFGERWGWDIFNAVVVEPTKR